MNDVITTSMYVGFLCFVTGVILGQIIDYKRIKKERSQFVEILETTQRMHDSEVERISTSYEKSIVVYDKAVKCYEKAERRCKSQEGECKTEHGPGQ